MTTLTAPAVALPPRHVLEVFDAPDDLSDDSSEGVPVADGLPTHLVEPEDMHLYAEGRRFELVDGRLVEKNMSDYADLVASKLGVKFGILTQAAGSGEVLIEGSYRCFPDRPRLVRVPDVSFISAERLAGYGWDQSHVAVVPDLAVEVVSPGDLQYDVNEKVREYHAAGVRVVWRVDPDDRTVIVHPNGGRPRLLTADDELDGGDVLPGFRCRVADLFPARPPGGGPVARAGFVSGRWNPDRQPAADG